MDLIKRYTIMDETSGLRLHCYTFREKSQIQGVCLELGILSGPCKSDRAAISDLRDNIAFYLLSTAREQLRGRRTLHTPSGKEYWNLFLKNGGLDVLTAPSERILPAKLNSRKAPALAFV